MASPEESSEEIVELTDIIKKGSPSGSKDSEEDVDLSFEQELEDLFQDTDEAGEEPVGAEAAEETGQEPAESPPAEEPAQAGPEESDEAPAAETEQAEPEEEQESETPEVEESAEADAGLEDDLDALLAEGGPEEAGEPPAEAEEEPEPAEAAEESETTEAAEEPEQAVDDSGFEDELDALLAEGGEEEAAVPEEPEEEPQEEPEPAEAAAEEEDSFEDDLEKQLDESMQAATDEDIEKAAGPEAGEEDDFSADLDALLAEEEEEEKPAPAEAEEDEDIDLSGLDDLAAELGEEEGTEAREAAEEDEGDEDIDLSGLDDLLEELDSEEKPGATELAPEEAEEQAPELVETAEADLIFEEPGEAPEPAPAEEQGEEIFETAEAEEAVEGLEEATEEVEPLGLGFIELEEEEQAAEESAAEYLDAHLGAGETDLEVPPDLPPDANLGLEAAVSETTPELAGVMDRLEAMERRFSKELNRLQYRLDKAGAPELEDTEIRDLEGVPGLEERLATLEGKVLAREDLEALRATIDYEIMARIEKAVPAAAAKVIREEIDALIKDLAS